MRAWFVPQGTRIDALRAAPELALYSDRDLKRLLPYFDEITVPAGSVVAQEGERCGIVRRGVLIYYMRNQKSITFNRLGSLF